MGLGNQPGVGPGSSPVSTEIYSSSISKFRQDIELSAKQVLDTGNLSWKGYQATIEVAGAFAAASMRICKLQGGQLSEEDSAGLAAQATTLSSNFHLGMKAMKEVADLCYDKNWHCGRGPDEGCALIRAAGQIAMTLTDNNLDVTQTELRNAIKERYDFVACRLREQLVAEEFWGGLVAAAQMGTQDLALKKRETGGAGKLGE